MWVRGLKLVQRYEERNKWEVAPHVGAWIETQSGAMPMVRYKSHPMWVRGLKRYWHA